MSRLRPDPFDLFQKGTDYFFRNVACPLFSLSPRKDLWDVNASMPRLSHGCR
jgi:hypothetical protein